MVAALANRDVAREMLPDDATAASLLFNADANAVGEILRSLTFPEQNTDGDIATYAFGCYSTFVVREDAIPIEGQEKTELVEHYVGEPPVDLPDPEEVEWYEEERRIVERGCTAIRFFEGGVQIDCFWYWDGDGYLLYRISSGESRRMISNNDCKKDYRWVEDERELSPEGSIVTMPVVEAMASALEGLISVVADAATGGAQPAAALQKPRQEADQALEAYRAVSGKGGRP